MSCPTWETLRQQAADAGLSYTAQELLRKRTARDRHQARVAATLEAAVVAISGDCLPATYWQWCLVAALLAIDLNGVGGPSGCGHAEGTGATVRMRFFAGLGSSRWHARDGGAYRAATEEAIAASWRNAQALRSHDINGALVQQVTPLMIRCLAADHLDVADDTSPDWSQGRDLPWLIAFARARVMEAVRDWAPGSEWPAEAKAWEAMLPAWEATLEAAVFRAAVAVPVEAVV